jgi:hypothetical protein
MSIAAEDWDDLAVVRRRRGQRAAAEAAAPETAAAEAPAAEAAEGVAAAALRKPVVRKPVVRTAVVAELEDDKDFEYDDAENLRPMLSIAGGNIAIFALAHLTGVVELIGVSFLASVGLLLAAYVLREWHRDRAALVCLVGGLPLPITIFSLLT